MINTHPKRGLFAFVMAFLAAIVLAPAGAAANDAASPGDIRCHETTVGKRKTSLGVHQWTVRLEAEWCVQQGARGPRIVSVIRDTRVRTGTNWKLVSRSGGVNWEGRRRATAESRFHFRLRYPYFEQNCYPRLAVEVRADGGYERLARTGC
jgi:hypothetical protein